MGLRVRVLARERAQDDGLDEAPDGVTVGVVRSDLAALARIEAALEQGAEDGGLGERPDELADLEEGRSLGARQWNHVRRVVEAAVESVDRLGAEQAAAVTHRCKEIPEPFREDVGPAMSGA